MSKTPTKARTTSTKRPAAARTKRDGTKAKVEAAQKRQQSRQKNSSGSRTADSSYTAMLSDHPWLVVGAGLLGGALIASLFPKGAAKKIGQSALAAATVGSEIASAFAKQTREAADDGLGALEDIGGSVSKAVTKNAAEFAGVAGKLGGEMAEKAGEAADRARSSGMALAREALKLAGRVRG